MGSVCVCVMHCFIISSQHPSVPLTQIIIAIFTVIFGDFGKFRLEIASFAISNKTFAPRSIVRV